MTHPASKSVVAEPRQTLSRSPFRIPILASLSVLAVTLLAPVAPAQGHRDHLTPQETEVVQNNQELDKRIAVFIKAIERRFAVINGVVMTIPKKKLKQGEVEDWGDAPKGTRAELLDDIAGLLDEAITNIDDVSMHDSKNSLVGSSVRKLAAAAKGFATQLEAMRTQAKDADELSAIQRALENSEEIIAAANKTPAPVEEPRKKQKP